MSDEKHVVARTKLKPHTTCDYVVVVPYRPGPTTRLGEVFLDSVIFNMWCISLVAFIVARLLIRYSHPNANRTSNALINIPFNTLGLTFATTSAGSVQSRSEHVLITFIAVSSMFTGTFCSGILLQTMFGSTVVPYFNSIADLKKMPSLNFENNIFFPAALLENVP